MTKNQNYTRERVLLVKCRLSFPALAEPRPGFDGGKAKYQANLLFEPNSAAHQAIDSAVRKVAQVAFPTSWQAILAASDKNPIHDGSLKADTAGYAGMLYICAKSDNRPLLKDADRSTIVTEQDIKFKFVPGYIVNTFVDVYPYWFRGNTGAVIRSGIGLGLAAVQFAGYADTFGGVTPPADDAFPDATAQAAATIAAGFAQAAGATVGTGYSSGAATSGPVYTGEDVPF